MNKQTLIKFPVSTGDYKLFIDSIAELARQRTGAAVYFANVHMFIEAHKDADFLINVCNADIVAPDGQPIAWMLRILYGIKQSRVAGMDALPDLLGRMEAEKLPVYFYGGTHEMINATRDYIKINFPYLQVAGLYSPPFRPLTQQEEIEIIDMINAASPAIIFVFIGCPRQENWISRNKEKINAVMAGIGGALPVTIGMQKRAPDWMRKSGFEWLFRLYKEPGRLFRRYFVTNSLFIWLMLKEIVRLKLFAPFSKSINSKIIR